MRIRVAVLALVSGAALVAAAGCGSDDGGTSQGGGGNGAAGGGGNGAAGGGGNGAAGGGGALCGNGLLDDGEDCDEPDLGGESCASRGFTGGSLRCGDDCSFDETYCLGDPAVFRTADTADVCGSDTPAQDCTPADMGFVASEYGSTLSRVDDADGSKTAYRLVAFVERVGPSNIDVKVVDEGNTPIEGVEVAFYFPSAPTGSRPDEWYPVKTVTPTNAQGVAGFALGGGAYIPACGAGGPHAVWVSEQDAAPDATVPSDLADKLGMLGGTNHRHLELIFQRVPPDATGVDAASCPL